MIGRLAYASLFVLALPAALVFWARRLDQLLALPAMQARAPGLAIAAIGLGLMAVAMRDLWKRGGGLPMSPFPPERLVTGGAYAVIAHPIYAGAVLVTAGVSLAAGSGAGLWIVTPLLTLAIAAWVRGYESDATALRFGRRAAPFFMLPPDLDAAPTAAQRASVYVLVLVPWLVLFEAVELLGVPPDARVAYFAWESHLPVVPWTEAVYASTYVFVGLAPLLARSQRDLRRFALDGLWATLLIIPFYLLVPLIAPAKPVTGDGVWQTLMRWERAVDQPVTAFPAFHVVWACVAARLYSARWRTARAVWWAWAIAIAVSCVTVGMHALLDIAAGFAAYALLVNREAIWRAACDRAEALANSWREWSAGPVRFINHGLYPGIGTILGLAVALALLGTPYLGWLAGMVLATVLGGVVWAQVVEGSPQLLRPYGYFGSVLAVVFTAWLAGVNGGGQDGWGLLAATAIAGAIAQPFGRLRCLVQGCCHGRAADARWGIRYTHPRSRVTRLSALGGIPLHPTPLYSIAWTSFVALVLLRLWLLAAPLSFIVGCYFVLIGLGRFVEEHFRGEPQTATWGGLRLYQWLAIAFVVGGAGVTAIASRPAPPPAGFALGAVPIVVALGLVCALAYGLDFPRSSRRFSRLV
jgi:protein-S-isoprenylcysteine O-methyltransferase Ste14